MKINLTKLYIVYKLTRKFPKAEDVFDGKPYTLKGLIDQARKGGGLRIHQVHGIYTTKSEAEKEANQILKESAKGKKHKIINLPRGQGYAIFLSYVKAGDKYRIPSKPKVYKTRALAEKALKKELGKGWKKSELKILKY